MGAQDTIFALSSGPLPSGVAVVRISGSRCHDVVSVICGEMPKERRAALTTIRDRSGGVVDRGIVIRFNGPRSFTGEDSAELQVHGSKAVVKRLLQVLGEFEGLRIAEAGEFTLRAFLNGRFDLTGVEGLADLISADTEEQRIFALENSQGKHGDYYQAWRERLTGAMAYVEATVDFSDEGDVGEAIDPSVWKALFELADEIDSHVKQFHIAEIIMGGFQVVILGPPNSGKSSLLNALARRDVAIVTDEPGTTRDLLSVDLDLAGIKVVVTDTAGIRSARNKVEIIGMERAMERAKSADLVLLLTDMKDPRHFAIPTGSAPVLKVGNKSDLCPTHPKGVYDITISVSTGRGLDRLIEIIEDYAKRSTARPEMIPFRERHISHLRDCSAALRCCLALDDEHPELKALELRRAADALGRIVGRIDVEDMLDVIFSRFCVGK